MSKEKSIDLKTRFNTEIVHELKKELGVKNSMSVPRIKKVTINCGIGTFVKTHNKDYSSVVDNITAITGQKPIVQKARLAVSNFKIKKGDPVGVVVTIRGKRMYDFLNKLINVVFPRVRDFRGIPKKAFDKKGNYTVGFKEHIMFPEISPDDVLKIHGLQIVITTTAENADEGFKLLSAMGFPFRKN